MKITKPSITDDTLRFDVDASIYRAVNHRMVGDDPFDLTEISDLDAANAALVAALLPAMTLGEDLDLDGPVSSLLLNGTETVQDIFRTWDDDVSPGDPHFHRVSVRTPTVAGPRRSPGRGTASFFTGGVDSFHTVLKHRDEISTLVFVHGFDVPIDDLELRACVSATLRDAAAELGLPLLEVESDLQWLGGVCGLNWLDYHGAALISIAHLLSARFDRVYVPATSTYAALESLGSHPLLDPLWSSEDLQVVHDGADLTRLDKVRGLADDPVARRHLRVCWENRDGAYNCGRCEKCIRTGVAARIAGVEGRFATLPSPSLRDVAMVRVPGLGGTWTRYRDDLTRSGADPRLKAAIDLALLRRKVGQWPLVGRWVR